MVPINDLSRRLPSYDQEMTALSTAVRSGSYFGGPFTRAFESSFAELIGVSDCVGVASGTDALALALAGLGVRAGSTVITTANAGYYSTSAILRLGARPVYADVLPDTAMMDPKSLQEVARITPPDVVLVTHMYGGTAQIREIFELCRRFGCRLLEDCAHSAGARVDAGMVGSFGDLAAFSFYPTKNLGALGDAGAILGADPSMMREVRALAQYGWSSRFVVSRPGGTNSRLDEIQAAVLGARLHVLPSLNDARRTIIAQYRDALAGWPIELYFEDSPSHVAHLAVLRCSQRDDLRRALTADGIASEIHYPVPDHLQPVSQGFVNPIALPVTENLVHSILTIPCFPTMTSQEVDEVCRGLISAAERVYGEATAVSP